jgi:hypothetical protein
MDMDIRGREWNPAIKKLMMSPGAYRARALVRRNIAAQDLVEGDTWAAHNNLREAERLEREAHAYQGDDVARSPQVEPNPEGTRIPAPLPPRRPDTDGSPVRPMPKR